MFSAGDIYNICHKLMLKYQEKSVIQAANMTSQLANDPVTDSMNHKPFSDKDIAFAAKNQFAAIVKKKKVTDRAQKEFRQECLNFLYSVTDKI